jgi:putative ABC transport system permease protein
MNWGAAEVCQFTLEYRGFSYKPFDANTRDIVRVRVGIANVMVISVLERRGEIGLRRALGATRTHVATQFVIESSLLAVLGGFGGIALGAGAVVLSSATGHQPTVLPAVALIGGLVTAALVGTVAGAYPALRAARLVPTEALRSA